MWKKIDIKPVVKNNPRQKIIDEYTKTDFKGYAADERFTNMIDDALHTFYASHCDFFITMDSRCLEKAKNVYLNLKIPTKACSLSEFIQIKKVQ